MSADLLRRRGALAAVLGGGIWCLFFSLLSLTAAELYQALIGLFALPAGAAALMALSLRLLLVTDERRLALPLKVGLAVALTGKSLFALGAFIAAAAWPAAYGLAILGELMTTLGLLLFGVSNLAARMLARWNVLPLLLALVYPPSWMLDPGSLPAVLRIGPDLLAALYGLGWMLLGCRLWADASRPATSAQAG